jgi:hypothetical protein
MKDVTRGLPRVVEPVEARHPRDKAVIIEVDNRKAAVLLFQS